MSMMCFAGTMMYNCCMETKGEPYNMDKEMQGSLSTGLKMAVSGLKRSYAPYTYDHVENIIIKLSDMLRDIRCSIGLSRTSKDILLGEALDSVDFVKKLMEDSKQSLGKIEFISYCDGLPDPIEDCCKNDG